MGTRTGRTRGMRTGHGTRDRGLALAYAFVGADVHGFFDLRERSLAEESQDHVGPDRGHLAAGDNVGRQDLWRRHKNAQERIKVWK